MTSNVPDFSALASKPPQKPTAINTSSTGTSSNAARTPSSNNYTTALASASPSYRPLPLRSPSSNNYTAALAESQARRSQPTTPHSGSGSSTQNPFDALTASNTSANSGAATVTSPAGEYSYTNSPGYSSGGGTEDGPVSPGGWRPRMDRMQSWNEQDMKRKFQERLLSPREEKGFSSKG